MSDIVREFTENIFDCEKKPTKLSKEKAIFVASMVLSEMAELLQTVCDNNEEVIKIMHDSCETDLGDMPKQDNEVSIIANQADAMVDAIYYLHDTAIRHGINLDTVFAEVHRANMSKKWPDGTFHVRKEDGKVLKPDNFIPPNIESVIEKQLK